jgi:NADPH:quinone reductase-like Zn-dependent oxidoreductase
VTDFKVGDRVLVIGAGSHSEYSLVTESIGKMIPIPDEISLQDAVAFGLQLLTALYLVEADVKQNGKYTSAKK